MIEQLPVEIVQRIVFWYGIGVRDVVGVAMASKTMYGKVFGGVGEENEFDVDQHKALAGVEFCASRGWGRAGEMALSRGYGDVGGSTSCLIKALGSGLEGLAVALVADGREDPSAGDNEAIRKASMYGFADVVVALLADARVDPAANFQDSLLWAAGEGHADVVRLLLADDRVDPSFVSPIVDDNPLQWASENGHADVVALLLADDRVQADPVALAYARQHGHGDVVELFEPAQPAQ